MTLKLLQLNIFQGKFFENIIDFVRKNDIDILHFQEVTSGRMSKGGAYNYPKSISERESNPNNQFLGLNCFEEIKNQLSLNGEYLITSSYINDPISTIGNATFFKKTIQLINKDVIFMKEFFEIPQDFTDIPQLSRGALILTFEFESKKFTTINTHLTWGPNSEDEPYKIEQAKKLYEQIKQIQEPFILTGDFNVTPATKTASMFNDMAKNLTTENKVINTLNEKIHPAKRLFPPGLAVDYIFTSDQINVKSFRRVDETELSDHYGLFLEFDV